jgi:hypothetical protein
VRRLGASAPRVRACCGAAQLPRRPGACRVTALAAGAIRAVAPLCCVYFGTVVLARSNLLATSTPLLLHENEPLIAYHHPLHARCKIRMPRLLCINKSIHTDTPVLLSMIQLKQPLLFRYITRVAKIKRWTYGPLQTFKICGRGIRVSKTTEATRISAGCDGGGAHQRTVWPRQRSDHPCVDADGAVGQHEWGWAYCLGRRGRGGGAGARRRRVRW